MSIEINDVETGGHYKSNQSSLTEKGKDTFNQLELEDPQIRAAIFSFFGSLFLQPITEDLYRQINNSEFLGDLEELLPGVETLQLTQYFSNIREASVHSELAKLKQEYMNLFAVPTGQYVAPFEDIYPGVGSDSQAHRGPLLGVRAIAAKKLYRDAGATIDNICKELPNHIGVEISFMHYLCKMEAQACGEDKINHGHDYGEESFPQNEIYRAYQIRFLREHLIRWYPQLNYEIQKKARHLFYKNLANLVEKFLHRDLEVLLQLTRDRNGV